MLPPVHVLGYALGEELELVAHRRCGPKHMVLWSLEASPGDRNAVKGLPEEHEPHCRGACRSLIAHEVNPGLGGLPLRQLIPAGDTPAGRDHTLHQTANLPSSDVVHSELNVCGASQRLS